MNNHSTLAYWKEILGILGKKFRSVGSKFSGRIASKYATSDLLVVSVVGEALHDEVVDPIEGGLLLWRVLDRHGNQGDVGVGWLHHVLRGVVLGDSMIWRIGRAHVPRREVLRYDRTFS